MSEQPIKLMSESEIPDFVYDVINAGCDICAIGDDMYVIGDADIPDEDYEKAASELRRIKEKYGERDFLRHQIVAHLRSLGRYLDDPKVAH
ncbi:hypothetical protein [Phyllobacterium sp. SB3]|uniref:hypothetical protein n=1 Tax=Phyllobacterium sp. SB3 TaxID=3156073 RepID=UPI0032AEE20B